MEDEFYHLTVKGNDLKTYVRRFQELATLCPTMVPDSKKMMEVFIGGLPRSIEGNVTASKPQTLEEAINIAQRLMDQEENIMAENLRGMDKAFEIRLDGTHCIKNRSWLLLFGNLRELKLRQSRKKTSWLKTYEEWTKHLKYVLMELVVLKTEVGYYSLVI
ncbi:hypothetical protein Tco_1455566 [Tanacetum coccineum]